MDSDRNRVIAKVRGLMAMTVANGCTEQEELAAARMVGKLLAQIGESADTAPASHRRSVIEERLDSVLLEKAMTESVLKSAVMELAVTYINVVSPPAAQGGRWQTVAAQPVLESYLFPMLGVAGSRLGAQVVRLLLADLIADGQLPDTMAVLKDE